MDEVISKWLVIEADGEAALRFPIASLPDGERFNMIEAVLSSNPTVRLVDKVEIGDVWNGSTYTTP